jgi:transcriptional regulator with XRE-family HTH domain
MSVEWGETIRWLRKTLGVTQREFAHLLVETGEQTIVSYYESGRVVAPSLRSVEALAESFGTGPWALLALADSSTPDAVRALACTSLSFEKARRRIPNVPKATRGRKPGQKSGHGVKWRARAEKVRDLLGKGLSQSAIAAEIGVSRQAVSQIVNDPEFPQK